MTELHVPVVRARGPTEERQPCTPRSPTWSRPSSAPISRTSGRETRSGCTSVWSRAAGPGSRSSRALSSGARRRGERDVHGPQDQLRSWGGAHLPCAQPDAGQDRGGDPGPRTPGKALLPAFPARQARTDQGAARDASALAAAHRSPQSRMSGHGGWSIAAEERAARWHPPLPDQARTADPCLMWARPGGHAGRSAAGRRPAGPVRSGGETAAGGTVWPGWPWPDAGPCPRRGVFGAALGSMQ